MAFRVEYLEYYVYFGREVSADTELASRAAVSKIGRNTPDQFCRGQFLVTWKVVW